MKRRTYLATVGGGALAGLAGCLTQSDDGDGGSDGGDTTSDDGTGTTTGTPTATRSPEEFDGTLRVATYSAFVDAPSTSPGPWLKEAFEQAYPNATLTFEAPENGLNNYIQRKKRGEPVNADLYVGLNVDDLITVDEQVGDGDLFAPAREEQIPNAAHVKDGLRFDPDGRAIPYDTGYISLVFDENRVDDPQTFEDLTTSDYEGTLLAQNAQSSDPGRAFLLWTIANYGADGYLDYWEDLLANDVKIFGDWDASYNAYSNGERPIVVSYSTDQVYAASSGADLSKHQIGFLNDQGYANPEGMAVFADTDNPDLARRFMDFVLSKRAQSEIAVRNVQFPATDNADPGGDFGTYAKEPPEPVTFGYEKLQGNLTGWVEDWARLVARK